MNCEKSAEPIVVKKFQIKMPEDKRNNVSTAVFRQPVFIMKNIIYASINEGGAVITEKNDLYLWGDNTYGQLGNGKKDGWYFGDSDKECWFKPKKVMKDQNLERKLVLDL